MKKYKRIIKLAIKLKLTQEIYLFGYCIEEVLIDFSLSNFDKLSKYLKHIKKQYENGDIPNTF